MKSKNLILVFIILTFIVSCQKNDNSLSTSLESERTSFPVAEYTVENDIVWFRDMESFNSIISDLHTYNRDSLINWEIENDFFYSYRRILDSELINDTIPDNNKPEKLIIEDPVFATLVNQDGLFVIGDTIHMITYEKEYLIPVKYLQELTNIEKNINNPSGLESYGISTSYIQRMDFRNNTKSVNGWNLIKKQHPDAPTYLSAHLKCWCVNYLVYGSIGIRITGRKKDGDWRDDRMQEATVDGCAWGGPSWSPPVEYCGSKTKENEKNVSKTLLWYTGIVYCDSISCTYSYRDGGFPTTYQWTILWD